MAAAAQWIGLTLAIFINPVSVDDRTGEAQPAPPPHPETLARTVRRWHDGTGMGLAWQIIIFVGGIIPALLSVTGTIIWWRARKGWTRAETYRRNQAAPQPAE